MQTKPKRRPGTLVMVLLGLLLLCFLSSTVTLLSNSGLPTHSPQPDRLEAADLNRAAEAAHLRQSLGEQVWPGWSEPDLPLILFNEANAFLLNSDGNPANGWIKVPTPGVKGGPWQQLPGENFNDRPVYFQPTGDAARQIGAFTVLVGDRWAAAFHTRTYSQISFQQSLHGDLPPLIRDIFPYRLATHLMLGDDSVYLMGLMHETFHAYQGMLLPDRLAAAEKLVRLEDQYPWDDHKDEWKAELNLLDQAVHASSQAETLRLTQQFLDQRAQRRTDMGLSAEMIAFEQQREWLEGLAQYAGLSAVHLAATTPGYTPIPALEAQPGFSGYEAFEQFYQIQLSAVKLQNSPGETRFYYTGLSQALLLDRLDPAWKPQAMQQDTLLETLLADAVRNLQTTTGN